LLQIRIQATRTSESASLLFDGVTAEIRNVASLLIVRDGEVVEKYYTTTHFRSRGSSGSTVSDYGLDDRGSIPDRGRGFFF
jgi:hypothetical protein